ncbi:hypothetical protein AMK01_PB00077 (plasmid) [Rhizobium sp. N6212]|nr:hypothetical protein AMK01_PB00077 [Rhizobium sp. N6212]ANL00146.1 hypothetical protein AMK00_PB00076 [Rhizobium sp. N621]ANL06274.1 hypothetical protein AMJ99_PB00075 [Rhizobium esperanzae]ANL12440.1 hypothetical protein AMJ98_PC00076 [Rhizobium sp. N1341]ANL24404.1 hypothetical protein AMJ96_PB00083 [Rhizobium sp. N113]ANM37115.1 hypothetical protein AMK04_PB00077 [Rhizobium sp. N871]ANM43274.1 hypothetical protein AMK03_PC00076 [Rhizobium sp. N741]
MPTVLFRHDQDISLNDVLKIAVYAKHVAGSAMKCSRKMVRGLVGRSVAASAGRV